ncbi:hypothetical protein Bbelb_181570 [Branchiostoma belcheri]|nr:hypothetical protein Bbelb_181570 [Branchiostoma belcheri]
MLGCSSPKAMTNTTSARGSSCSRLKFLQKQQVHTPLVPKVLVPRNDDLATFHHFLRRLSTVQGAEQKPTWRTPSDRAELAPDPTKTCSRSTPNHGSANVRELRQSRECVTGASQITDGCSVEHFPAGVVNEYTCHVLDGRLNTLTILFVDSGGTDRLEFNPLLSRSRSRDDPFAAISEALAVCKHTSARLPAPDTPPTTATRTLTSSTQNGSGRSSVVGTVNTADCSRGNRLVFQG